MSKTGKNNRRVPVSTIVTRVFVGFLAALMILGSCYYLVVFMFMGSKVEAASKYSENMKLRIGLMYGSNVTIGFRTTSSAGFAVGYVDPSNNFVKLSQTSVLSVSATCDANLSNNGGTFAKTDENPVIGAYHIQIDGEDDSVYAVASDADGKLAALGLYAFPAYINGVYCVRIGSFFTEETANAALGTISADYPEAKVVGATASAVSLVDPKTSIILFEFDDPNNSNHFAIESIDPVNAPYLLTPAGNKYEGTFEFRRNPGSVDGVSLINVIPLETYVEGVLPYEISSSWPLEAQKCFAVAVRSFAISKLGRHTSMGFDLCYSTCCQVYRGSNRVTTTVKRAVAETKGMVGVSNGKLVSSFYSSSVGGSTVAVSDCWGGSLATYPYLAAIATPWERYEEYSHGSWTVSVTPEQLATTLRANGYTTLTGNIASVKINSFGTNSTYVNSVTFTDTAGHSVTINRSDKIRTVLSSYLYSANFVVGTAGSEVTVTDYSLDGFSTSQTIDPTSSGKSVLYVKTADGVKTATGTSVSIKTATGTEVLSSFSVGGETVMSSAGTSVFDLAGELSSGKKIVSVDKVNGKLPDITTLSRVTTTRKVKVEGKAGSFVFVGRGWGHGVGMSQWGIKDLSDLGYSYDAIFKTYLRGTSIIQYTDITK